MLNTVILGKYEIRKQVRENDLFVEYWGRDTQTNRDVTVAAIHARHVSAADFFARFDPVNKKLAGINSRHAPVLVELGEVDGQAVIIRQHVEGQSLRGMLEAGNLPLELVLNVAQQLGEYLDLLHQAGLTQIAFELEDVLIAVGDAAQVTNFGFAQGVNLGGLLFGNKLPARTAYAPELLKGGKADARTDFYSLGALLFEALTGKKPSVNFETADKTVIEDFFPSRLRMGISTEWDALVAKCLHPNPARRIQSAAEFLNQVDEVHRAMTTLASDTPMGMEDSLVGQTLGSYRLVSRLGQGGMATVYKAYEPALDRYVAIKVLPQFFAKDPVFVQRFRREAKAVAQLNHPNIVPIYSYGETNGITYIAMQFVIGDTLKHEGQKFTFEEALRLLSPIARALGYAHQRGVVHRDIKPSNILIAEDGNWPLLADFGLAQMAQASGRLTESGVGMGTPMYMSPEQGQGEKVDQRTDLYSLGIVLYELVTGDVPFRADTPMAIVIKHISAPMPMPSHVNPDVPDYLEALILKATAKNPDDRYQTAEEMARAMENALALLSSSPPVTRTQPAQTVASPAATPAPQPKSKPAPEIKAEITHPSAAVVVLQGVGSFFRGIFKFVMFMIILALLLPILIIGGMAALHICLPQVPGIYLPWCEGSQSSGGQPAPATPAPSILTNGKFGDILFQDDFDGSVSPHWLFVCDPNTSPWIAEEIDGRTVFHSQPPKPPGNSSCAEFRDTGWQEYAIQFNFKFLKPNLDTYSFSIAGRATNCPPPIAGVQQYVSVISNDGVFMHKGTCKPDVTQLTEKRRYIAPDAWHTFQYIFVKNRVQLLIDGETLIDFVDEHDPILEGGDIWFVTEGSAEILVDDLKVYEIVPAASETTPAQTIFMLDDFESGPPEGRSDWESYFEDNKDTGLGCLKDAAPHSGLTSLKFGFDVAENSWATCGFYFDSVRNWGGGQGVAFYLRSDKANMPYEIWLFSGTPGARTTYVYAAETPPESVDGWVRVEIPWSEILGVEWEANSGKPIDPAAVTGFAIGLSTPEGSRQKGTLWLDDLQLLAASGAVPDAVFLDRFEAKPPAGRSDWQTNSEDGKDTNLDCQVEDTHNLRDSNYLRFKFDVAKDSWASCGFFFDAAQDWSAGNGIAFYLRSDQPNAEYQIELFGGTPEAQTTYVYWTKTPPESVDDWVLIEIPWEEILRADWENNPGTVFDPAIVTGFIIGISSPQDSRQSGTLWMDDLQLLPKTGGVQTGMFLDDFERFNRPGLEAYFLEGSDTKTACSLDNTIAYESTASLKFSFDIAPDAWASCGSSFNDVKDWSAGQGIAFYVHAGQAGLPYEVNLFGGPLGVDETYLHELTTTPESVNGWERIEVYWKDILRADWEDHAGMPVNPASIIGFSFDTSASQQTRLAGAIWIDDFQVIP